MSLRSTHTRIAIALAAGSMVALTAAGPALADGEGGFASNSNSNSTGSGSGTGSHEWNNTSGGGNGDGDGREWSNGSGGDGRETGNGRGDGRQDNPRQYKGRITARGGLALRSAPNRGSQLIRVARQGEIVSIYCKTPGQKVDGNPLWYLLTDGTWAWGAARYIDNIGAAPRWC
ncbi:SH3 domain-containing protein [Streptomyces sp. NPDC048643]|uniref:SH3 domain-containing protein n=1 Tax=Streptomyces sp. NPDC048643 TaxID=3155637 RepID=UPI003414B48D